MSLDEEKSRPREEMYSKSSLTSQLVLDIVHSVCYHVMMDIQKYYLVDLMPSRTGSSLLLFLTCHLKISNFRLKLLKIEVCLNFSFIAASCPDVSCVVGGVVLGHHHCLLRGVAINLFFLKVHSPSPISLYLQVHSNVA